MKSYVPLVLGSLTLALAGAPARGTGQEPAAPKLRFEVTLSPGVVTGPKGGRLMVVIHSRDRPEPRFRIGEPGRLAAPVLGRDARGFAPGETLVLDATSALFPLESLADLEPGDYHVQALLMCNDDHRATDAVGNLYSKPLAVHLDPAQAEPVRLTLEEKIPFEEPKETESVRYVHLRSKRLSRFFDRPITLRAGIILPPGYDQEPQRKYPLRVHIGGYAARYTTVRRMMREDDDFYQAWAAEDAPKLILLHLDGAGPYGDPYQVNSANNGPWGDAVVRELIPYVEKKFRAVGKPHARVLDGHSTGGWVSFALQTFYPHFFNGTWSSGPDPLDFRALQLVNVYENPNAYTDAMGEERPSSRTTEGAIRYSMRHEVQMENVMGLGDSWTMSGRQWGSWNAVFSPRGADGRPLPLWDPKSGAINPEVARAWRKYDLREILEDNWSTLSPQLRGKLHVAVGEMDNYYLNNAVHLLDQFLVKARPPFEGTIAFGNGRGHQWNSLSEGEMMEAMAKATGTAEE